MQNFVPVFHTVCAHVEGHKNFGDAGARPLGWALALLTPRNTLLPTCVTVPNLDFLGKTIRA